MFGEHHRPPRAPKYEPLILLLLAVLIASAVTAVYFLVMAWVERGETPF
jgi:hypothetical protein